LTEEMANRLPQPQIPPCGRLTPQPFLPKLRHNS
jgi:hypothetical protein